MKHFVEKVRNVEKARKATLLLSLVTSLSSVSWASTFPEPTSDQFCVEAQKFLANTDMKGNNTVFKDMPAYRASKPSPDPLTIYQVVTYDKAEPIMVSCKVKTADHIKSAYGDNKAGEQRYCPDITKVLLDEVIAELEQTDPAAATRAKTFNIIRNEPYTTGRSYLEDFELSYFDMATNVISINTPGLQTDWENWMFWILPNMLRGQTYCHVASKSYLKGLATGEITPGKVVGTADDAPTQPGS